MKKMLAMLFVVVMILSCVPVMAVTVPDGGAVTAAATKSTSSSKTGWRKKSSRYRYYYTKKKYYKNTLKMINGYVYAFDKNGYVQKGWVKKNNKWFYASTNTGASPVKYGALLTGLRNIGGAYYYLNPNGGAMLTGLVKIGAKYYYFTPGSGRQVRTANTVVTANGYRYKVLADTSLQYLGVAPVNPDPYGMNKKAQGYSSSTRYLILVNKSKHIVNIYQGKKGSWSLIRGNMLCTIGKKSTPTKSGNFNLSTMRTKRKYGYKDFGGSTAFYAARINAGNFFHSILYKKGCRNPYNAKPKDATLGKNKSNSCIRLTLENARYIYEKMPLRTAVIVY